MFHDCSVPNLFYIVLRKQAVEWLDAHPDYLLINGCTMSSFHPSEPFDVYLTRMAKDGEYGDDLTLTACSECRTIVVHVVHPDGHIVTIRPLSLEHRKEDSGSHFIVLRFSVSGEHYDCIRHSSHQIPSTTSQTPQPPSPPPTISISPQPDSSPKQRPALSHQKEKTTRVKKKKKVSQVTSKGRKKVPNTYKKFKETNLRARKAAGRLIQIANNCCKICGRKYRKNAAGDWKGCERCIPEEEVPLEELKVQYWICYMCASTKYGKKKLEMHEKVCSK